ncbi:O-antigen ligase family protein [Prosthecobacter sp.]|uniref:O-antigen ligase family protein n=1 Tax=Prosthecobacter sp. TaxID=1965333 RepID=UPI0037847B71
MISISIAIMVFIMAMDFASERLARYVLALAVTAAGFITAIAGLCLHSSGELTALWQVKHVPDSVFGLFWYHGNAAAFLNLTWPVGVWLGALLLQRGLRNFKQQMMLSLLVVAVMLQVIAVFVNVSKMGHLLLTAEMVMLVVSGLLVWKPDMAALPFGNWRTLLLILIGLGLLGAGAWLSGAGAGLERWNVFATRHFDDPARRHAAIMALQMGWDHGWTGTGPGTFEWVSVHYSALDPILAPGRWRHAHNDYTEFFAEWGWPGVMFFVLLLAFPVRRWCLTLRQVFSKNPRLGMSFQRKAGQICFTVAIVSTLLHAFVDFPLQIDATRHLFAVMMGMVMAMTTSSAPNPSKRETPRREWLTQAEMGEDLSRPLTTYLRVD